MPAANGRFSMTVGENWDLKVGVEVLSEGENAVLSKSLVSDVAHTSLANYEKQISHKFQASQRSQMRNPDKKKKEKDVNKPKVLR